MASKKWGNLGIGIGVGFVSFGLVVFLVTRAHYTKNPGEIVTFQAAPSGPTGITAPRVSAPPRPKNAKTLAYQGDRYFEARRFREAIELYRNALKLDPKDVDTHNDLGLALHYTGKSGEAVEILRKGTKIQPSFQRIWLSLGFILKSLDQNEEAKEALGKAADIDPKSNQGREALKMLGL